MPRADAATGAAIRFEVLGGFRLLIGDRPSPRPFTARQQQILTYLLLQKGGSVPRLDVASRLWPESTDAQALTNLRREWHHLREFWPAIDTIVDAGSRTLGWKHDTPTSDLQAFERTARSALDGHRDALGEAADLYAGDLLPSCHDDWIEPERDRLRRMAVEVLTTLVGLLEQEGAPGEVIVRAGQLLRLDSLNEPAWCALMRAHAQRGERATALHLYQECAALLKQELDVEPSAATRRTYREILARDTGGVAASTSTAASPTSVFPLVGRARELAVLEDACRVASGGHPLLALVRGEAGIGKTRLVEELAPRCRAKGMSVATARCYAGEGRLAYGPVATWLQSEPVVRALQDLDGVWVREVARLQPDVVHDRQDAGPSGTRLDPMGRTRFFEALARAFTAAAPLALVLDDAHWADADTIEWLQFFLRSGSGSRILVVATARSDEEADNPALVVLLDELERLERLVRVPLGPLDEAATARLAEEVAGRPLDAAILAQTFRQTEGQPLFVIEQGRMGADGADRATPPSPRVQAVVAARLAHLSEEARSVAEIASVIGRDFAYDVLAEVSDLEEDAVVQALDELWHRHIVRVQPGGRWDFSHDRIREVAYAGIGPARRRLLHRRIAQALERAFAADLDPVAAIVAMHLDLGGQPGRAIPFLERAAAVALRVSATEEVLRCLTQALELVGQMQPGRERDQRELALRTQMAGPLTSARGYASVEVQQSLERILALEAARGRELRVGLLWSVWALHFVLGELALAREVAERALTASREDPSSRCEAHHAMACTLTSLGEIEAARAHFQAALSLYDERAPQRSALGSDLGVFAHAFFAHDLWLLGEPDLAVSHAESAIALSRRLDDAFSQALALAYAGITFQMCGDESKVEDVATAVMALCERYGFAYYDDWGRILLGWVRGRRGDPAAGVALITSGLERLEGRRARARRPYYLSLLAETLAAAGRGEDATHAVDEAIETATAMGDRWWLPALQRQRTKSGSG